MVMVGEIRDKETATLAVQAALTGHLVFSTLHTNSAAGILPRLLDMGIEPFLIASTVHTVIGQRLVRRIVPGGEKYQSTKAETEAIHAAIGSLLPQKKEDVAAVSKDLGYTGLPLATQNAYTLFKGLTGPESPEGYKGRMGLYEVFWNYRTDPRAYSQAGYKCRDSTNGRISGHGEHARGWLSQGSRWDDLSSRSKQGSRSR